MADMVADQIVDDLLMGEIGEIGLMQRDQLRRG